MKKLIPFLTVLAIFFSCRKETATTQPENERYLRTVLAQLRDSLSAATFQTIDTNSTYLADPGNSQNYLLKVNPYCQIKS